MLLHQFIIIMVVFAFISFCQSRETNRTVFQRSLFVDHCDKLYTLACFKLDAANWMDRFDINNEISIIPGVTLLQNPNSVKIYTSDIAAEVAREFPDSKAKIDQLLLKRISHFLNNHSLKISLWNTLQGESEVTARKDKEKKGDNGMGMILIAGVMLIGVLTALAMGGLTALAGKALITGLVSFVLSAIIGLKQLTSSKGKTYIAQPVPVYTGTSHEGWEEYAGHRRSVYDEAVPKSVRPDYTPA